MFCQNCKTDYNFLNRKPIILPCSHNICFKCNYKLKKQNIYKCPFCDKQYDKEIKVQIDTQKMELIKMNHTNSLLEDSNLQILSENLYDTQQKFKYKFNFATLGCLNTGKTCILNQYFNKTFCQTTPTIAVEFLSKAYSFKHMNILLTATDTAGSEQYRSITSKYIQNKHILLFVFDLTDEKSFKDVLNWIQWSEDYSRENVIKVLVGNKKDLVDQRKVDKENAVKFATNLQMNYFEVSAKTGENLNRLFDFCLRKSYFIFKGEQKKEQQNEDFKLKVLPQQKRNCFSFIKNLFLNNEQLKKF